MSRRWRGLVGLAIVAAFIAGFASGSLLEYSRDRRDDAANAAREIGFSVDALGLLELEAPEKLARILEWRAFAGVTALMHQKEWSDIPEEQQGSLVLAKRWLEAYPPSELPESTATALALIPDDPLDPSSCNPVVRQLLRAAESDGI